jgi:2-oxoglutarate ferredoxin oxidoreductase subunit beta
VLVAIAAGAGFVARAFTGRKEHLVSMMKQAIEYPGYALVDILQPCVSFNKLNTFQWYNKRVYELGEDYDPSDKPAALARSLEFGEKIPLGVIYREEKLPFHRKNETLRDATPLLDRAVDPQTVEKLIRAYL